MIRLLYIFTRSLGIACSLYYVLLIKLVFLFIFNLMQKGKNCNCVTLSCITINFSHLHPVIAFYLFFMVIIISYQASKFV